MWQKRQAELLREELEMALAPLVKFDDLYQLVKEPLTVYRRGLSAETEQDRPWPLLPLMVCEAVSGDFTQALPAAAALQLLMAAGDVFDDIEDADSEDSLAAKHGPGLSANAATALLILAEKALLRLKARNIEDNVIFQVMDSINSGYTAACAGQHLDLRLSAQSPVPEDRYLEIISLKSASQVECACRAGALLATRDSTLIDKFTLFGHNLGMAAQITNDIQGTLKGNDIVKKKITLPALYALNQAEDEDRIYLEQVFSPQSQPVVNMETVRDLFFRTGAVYYATLKMEIYRQAALETLAEIKEAGINAERLRLLLQ